MAMENHDIFKFGKLTISKKTCSMDFNGKLLVITTESLENTISHY